MQYKNYMRAIFFISIAAAASLVLFQTPVRGQTPDARKAVALEKVLTVNCPDQVPTAITVVPSGWSAASGPEAREKLLSVVVTGNAKNSIGCIYGHKGEYGAFVLSRTVPVSYECKPDTWPVPHAVCRLRTVAR